MKGSIHPHQVPQSNTSKRTSVDLRSPVGDQKDTMDCTGSPASCVPVGDRVGLYAISAL